MDYRQCLVGVAILAMLGGCSDGTAPPDGGVDSGIDAGIDGADSVDDDPIKCGNGTLDDDEACDKTVFRDDMTCASLSLPAGSLSCTDSCEIDTTGCAVCDDGICSDGENASSCVADCGVVSISAGRKHTCGVLADGSLWCWGAHIGHGMGGTPDTSVPVLIPGFDDVAEVAAGYHSTCFRTQSNAVYCFGRSGFGESGASLDYEVFPPVQVNTGDPPQPLVATDIEAGGHHHCAITTQDSVVCWGRGDYGQRGDIQFSSRLANATVVEGTQTGFDGITSVSLGENFGCALAGTSAKCWGGNTQGQIGSNPAKWYNYSAPVYAHDTSAVGTGAFHNCLRMAISGEPQFRCRGSNAYGQLGEPASADPTQLSALNEDLGLVVGGFGFSCGVTLADGMLLCWGDNDFGQLGDGTNDSRYQRAPVVDIGEVKSVEAGYDHMCAILADDTARCWGRNREGQLGNGSEAYFSNRPVAPLRFGP